MPKKIINISNLGDISFYKHHGSKTIKIRISGSEVKVTLPTWVPYSVASDYVKKRSDWILANRKPANYLYNGCIIGKNIKLNIQQNDSTRFSSKLLENYLIIKIPRNVDINSKQAQSKIGQIAKKAILSQSYNILLPHVRNLANQHKFDVKSIEIKELKSRWGSCSSKNELSFSLYLIQLPWHCINYVIYHEFAHTIHHNHGSEFWDLVAKFEPKYRSIRKEMKHYSPELIPQNIKLM